MDPAYFCLFLKICLLCKVAGMRILSSCCVPTENLNADSHRDQHIFDAPIAASTGVAHWQSGRGGEWLHSSRNVSRARTWQALIYSSAKSIIKTGPAQAGGVRGGQPLRNQQPLAGTTPAALLDATAL